MFDDIKKLIADFRAGDWIEVLRDGAKIVTTLADWISVFFPPTIVASGAKSVGSTHPEFPKFQAFATNDLDSAISELESCHTEATAAHADPAKIDPATLALIIQAIVTVLKWIRDRRNPTP